MRSTLTRMLVVTTLLVILPFSGIRVVCFELPPDASTPAVPAEELTECERLCALHAPSDPSSSGTQHSEGTRTSVPQADTREGCALSSNGVALDCVSFSAIAVIRTQEPPQAPVIARNLFAENSRLHVEPALTPAGPPPKLQAL